MKIRKVHKNKYYFFEQMRIDEVRSYPCNLRDSIKTVLWRCSKLLGYKYKMTVTDKYSIVQRIE